MNPLALLGGGGLSTSATATSGDAQGGYQDTGSGAFNFGTGAGSTGASPTTLILAAAGALVLGFLACQVMRK